MTALALFQRLHDLGVALTPYPDETLRYTAPKGVLTPALLEDMRQYKDGLHGLVEAFEERVAIMEYCGGLSRPEAERLALGDVLAPTPVLTGSHERWRRGKNVYGAASTPDDV